MCAVPPPPSGTPQTLPEYSDPTQLPSTPLPSSPSFPSTSESLSKVESFTLRGPLPSPTSTAASAQDLPKTKTKSKSNQQTPPPRDQCTYKKHYQLTNTPHVPLEHAKAILPAVIHSTIPLLPPPLPHLTASPPIDPASSASSIPKALSPPPTPTASMLPPLICVFLFFVLQLTSTERVASAGGTPPFPPPLPPGQNTLSDSHFFLTSPPPIPRPLLQCTLLQCTTLPDTGGAPSALR